MHVVKLLGIIVTGKDFLIILVKYMRKFKKSDITSKLSYFSCEYSFLVMIIKLPFARMEVKWFFFV